MQIVGYNAAEEKLQICFTNELVWEYLRISPSMYDEIKQALGKNLSIERLLHNFKYVGTLKEVTENE